MTRHRPPHPERGVVYHARLRILHLKRYLKLHPKVKRNAQVGALELVGMFGALLLLSGIISLV